MKKIWLTLEMDDATLAARFEKRFQRCHISPACMKCMTDYLRFDEEFRKPEPNMKEMIKNYKQKRVK